MKFFDVIAARSVLSIGTAVLSWVLVVPSSDAGLPDPMRSSCDIRGNVLPCQYRFRADGGLDHMTVFVTLRDAFDTPVTNCSTSATINLIGPPDSGGDCGYVFLNGAELCSCCDLRKTGFSNAMGVLLLEFSRLGGRGKAEVAVTADCAGFAVGAKEFNFTSPDLNGTCDPHPISSTSVIDFGIYAGCMPPATPCRPSDANCDCEVTVLDLAFYAGGLLKGCTGEGCS